MRLRVLLAAISLALLSGCANKPTKSSNNPTLTYRPAQIVGAMQGDTIEVMPGTINDKRVTAISVVRAVEENGRLGLCGALLLAAPNEDILRQLEDYAADANSELSVGEVSPVAIPPRFMHFEKRVVPSGMLEAKDVDFSALEGFCVVTEIPWRADFRSKNQLNLRKTTYRQGYTSMPIYVPQPRRR
ncbi:MAG: hypothetical protein H7Z12_10290 [Rhodospirillaceae bacterium]|nr:hypothetical protein [Rhodospirillales bacterium]